MAASLTRRAALSGVGTLFAWAYAPRVSSAAGSRDARLLVLVLRGGLDGLAAVPAVGDPAFDSARLAPELREANATLPLDGIFALNRNLPTLAAMYRAKEALIVHAVATPYRDRSHFDAQGLLETGYPSLAMGNRTGWLNRVLAALPRGERLPPPGGLAISATIPMILRGPAPVETWQKQIFRYADDDTISRLLDLYEAKDPALAEALRRGASLDGALDLAEALAPERGDEPENGMAAGQRTSGGGADMASGAAAAARFMAQPNGPRVAAVSFGGWDTHVDQGSVQGRLARQFEALDKALAALRTGLQPVWRDTVVAVVTEFGRTVRLNGSRGTDHGVGTIALLLGGAVRGGRVLADWPGLRTNQLYEGRDLNPTTDLRAVMQGVLAEHLGLDERRLASDIFPETAQLARLRGLIG